MRRLVYFAGNGRIISAGLEWQPHDLWIGVFWRYERHPLQYLDGWTKTDVWVCIVPMLPIHIIWQTTLPRQVTP